MRSSNRRVCVDSGIDRIDNSKGISDLFLMHHPPVSDVRQKTAELVVGRKYISANTMVQDAGEAVLMTETVPPLTDMGFQILLLDAYLNEINGLWHNIQRHLRDT